MSYKLFYSPGACSMAVHIALNEVGQKYELIKADLHGAQKDAALLAVNPLHQVPVLVDGDLAIREGAAILIHLMEKHKSPLLPASGEARTRAIEALCFCNASLHVAYSKMFMMKGIFANNEVALEQGLKATCDSIQKLWNQLDTELGKQKYLAGDTLTIADILMTVIANWQAAKPVTLGANVKRVIREVIARPSYTEALASENVTYKAAA